MSESVIFRTPTAPVEPAKSEPTKTPDIAKRASTATDDTDSPYLYKELEKVPYAVKHFDLKTYYNDDDFSDVKEQLDKLDDYVIKQARARGLKDSPDSYKEVIEGIYKQIGKSPNEDPMKSVKRLSIAADAIQRLEHAKLPPVLSAVNLEPDEYEGIQK